MFGLLLGASAIYLAMGDRHEAMILLGLVFVIMGITALQERRTDKALDALRDLSSPRALVLRGGATLRIPGSEVVRGDLLLLAEGDRVPADGLVRVEAVGRQTEMGRIGVSLQAITLQASPLHDEVARLTRRLVVIGLSLCVALMALFWLLRGGWLEVLLAGITLAMGILPQEFPVTMIVFFALATRRLARNRMAVAALAIEGDDMATLALAPGALPEAGADLCHLPAPQRQHVIAQAEQLADQGLRVLGVARARHRSDLDWPGIRHDFAFEWIGLVGFADPIRPEVPEAMAQCQRAGIRVVMITGDHPRTARAIAAQAGIRGDRVLSGDELLLLDAQTLGREVATVNIFARVRPQQKLALIEALKAQGEVVAMTGDRVNDAPALKAAHIGIAMGQRGTDVAREAASLVLLQDDFASIVQAIHAGRRTFANLRQAMVHTLAVHLPIVGLAMLPVLFSLPLVLTPLHIAFLELVVDPACSLVFEAEDGDPDLMNQPPRPGQQRRLRGAGDGQCQPDTAQPFRPHRLAQPGRRADACQPLGAECWPARCWRCWRCWPSRRSPRWRGASASRRWHRCRGLPPLLPA